MATINGIAVSLTKALFRGVRGWWRRKQSVEERPRGLQVEELGKDTFSIVVFSLWNLNSYILPMQRLGDVRWRWRGKGRGRQCSQPARSWSHSGRRGIRSV